MSNLVSDVEEMGAVAAVVADEHSVTCVFRAGTCGLTAVRTVLDWWWAASVDPAFVCMCLRSRRHLSASTRRRAQAADRFPHP